MRINPFKSIPSLTFAQKVSIIIILSTLFSLVLPVPKPAFISYLLAACAFVIVGVPLFMFLSKKAHVYVIFISIFLLSFGYASLEILPAVYPFGRSVKVRIRLSSYPAVRGSNLQFTARVLEVESGEGKNPESREFFSAFRRRGRVVFSMPFPRDPIVRGDIIETEGMFFPLPFDRSPGYARYLQSTGIEALLEGYRAKVDVVRRAGPLSPVHLSVNMRRYIERVHKRLLPPPHDAFATALLTGNRDYIPGYLMESFRNSGTMHILAVSGLHVGFICLFVLFLLRLVRVPKLYTSVLLGLFIVFFMIFIGERPSVRRASFMALCGIACFLLDRDRDYLNVLALAFIILWIMNPLSLLNPGFLLSFCATFGILFLMPVLYRWLARFMPGFIAGSIAVTLSVQLFIFPVMASFFGTFAWINVAANLPIVPLTGASLALGVITLVLYHVFLPLAVIFAEVNTVVIATIARVAVFFSRVPTLRINIFPVWLIPFYLAAVTVLLAVCNERLRGTQEPEKIPDTGKRL